MGIRLFPNRRITDDTGRPVPATGQLLGRCLNIAGFSVGKRDDPWWREAINVCIGIFAFIAIVVSIQQVHAWIKPWSCWLTPVWVILLWLCFHQVRIVVAKRSDEEELQDGIPAYRLEHPDQCPACDGPLSPIIEDDEHRLCQQCGAAWTANPPNLA